jgi:LPXTG-motif cell wall-anchored protein
MAAVATPTALPRTGFAERVGIPGLIGLAIASIIVIFVVRRVRASTM